MGNGFAGIAKTYGDFLYGAVSLRFVTTNGFVALLQ